MRILTLLSIAVIVSFSMNTITAQSIILVNGVPTEINLDNTSPNKATGTESLESYMADFDSESTDAFIKFSVDRIQPNKPKAIASENYTAHNKIVTEKLISYDKLDESVIDTSDHK